MCCECTFSPCFLLIVLLFVQVVAHIVLVINKTDEFYSSVFSNVAGPVNVNGIIISFIPSISSIFNS